MEYCSLNMAVLMSIQGHLALVQWFTKLQAEDLYLWLVFENFARLTIPNLDAAIEYFISERTFISCVQRKSDIYILIFFSMVRSGARLRIT